MRPGWIPSWEAHFYADDPSVLLDPTGEMLDPEVRESDEVRAFIEQVSATPIDADAARGDFGGFESWRSGLADQSDAELIARLAQAEQLARVAAAQQLALVGEFASRRNGSYWIGGRARSARDEFVADHLAVAMGISLRSAERRIYEAETLRDYPKVLSALGAGLISMPGLRAFLQEVANLDFEHSAEVETRVLNKIGEPWIPDLGSRSAAEIAELPFVDVVPLTGNATPGEITRWTRSAISRVDAVALRRTKEKAAQGSKVELQPDPASGMAWFGAWTTEERAVACWDRVDTEARRRLNGHHDDRGSDPYGDGAPLDGTPQSLDQVRAEVFFDFVMTDSNREGSPIPVPVNIEVLVDAAGDASTPTLGPIPPTVLEAFRELADRTGGTFRTTFQAPVTCPGEHPNGGHDDPYVVPAAMRRTVQLRDQTCRYPGCVRPAQMCDLDHTIPWPQGPTCPCNLSALCRHHHRLKTHEPGWSLTNHGDGHLTWRTPYGDYPSDP
jgi:hypothetical protein